MNAMFSNAKIVKAGQSRSVLAKGFSLVEIVVVITIIVLLMVFTVPAVQRVIDINRSATCAAKLRNIGAGLMGYIGDHEGDLIPAAVVLSGWFWFDVLNPYMGIYGMVRTGGIATWEDGRPVDEYPLGWQICPSKEIVPLSRQSIGYGWNRTYFGHDFTAANAYLGFGSKMSEVLKPEITIIIGDSVDKYESAFGHRYLYNSNSNFPHAERHRGAGNYLYLDGHVESHTPEFLKTADGQNLFRKNSGKK